MSPNVEIARTTETPRMTSMGPEIGGGLRRQNIRSTQIDRRPASSVVGPCRIATGLNQHQGSALPQRQPSRGIEQSPLENRLTRLGVCRRSGAGLPESLDDALVRISYDR